MLQNFEKILYFFAGAMLYIASKRFRPLSTKTISVQGKTIEPAGDLTKL